LYGLKQAPLEWNLDIHNYLTNELGYEQLECDKCIYIKNTSHGLIILCIYVDDTIIAYPKEVESIWLSDKTKIATKYAIKDVGDCIWILNMKVNRDRINHTITLSQEAYIKRILENFNHAECKTLINPCIDADLFLPPDGVDMTRLTPDRLTLYQSIVGSLLYAALTTRPDIAFAVSELSRFSTQATEFHLQAAYHTLRYLAGTTNQGLVFKSNGFDPENPTSEVYVDASWGNDLEARRSTTGLVVKFNGNVICWATKKQRTVALSSTEAEYMALTEATTEALWFQTWISEIFKRTIPITIYCDNQSAIALAKNDVFHQRTKHIDIRYHFIRQHVNEGRIIIKWIDTKKQQADILTKKLNNTSFVTLRNQLMTTV
jgi:hypothetical protein